MIMEATRFQKDSKSEGFQRALLWSEMPSVSYILLADLVESDVFLNSSSL